MSEETESIEIACPYCGQVLVADSSLAGAEVECPTCNQSFLAVQPESQTDQTIAGDDVSFETEATDSSETETSATAETENEPSDASVPQSLSPPKDSESREASQKVPFRAKVGKELSMLRTLLSSVWTRAKTAFHRLPERAQGVVLASVVILAGIAIFSGKGESRGSQSPPPKTNITPASDASSAPASSTTVSGSTQAKDLRDELADSLRKLGANYMVADERTVRWDPGGETPPCICEVRFQDDGTALMVQNHMFFAKEYPSTPLKVIGKTLEQEFHKANPELSNQQVRFLIASDGDLWFGGMLSVSRGTVAREVETLFAAMSKTRIRIRIY